jgi:hypothetical protein
MMTPGFSPEKFVVRAWSRHGNRTPRNVTPAFVGALSGRAATADSLAAQRRNSAQLPRL